MASMCEFGACGPGASSFGPGTGAALDPNNKFQYTVGSIAELLGFGMAYANWGDPNERFFGTHYFGPGGGGSEVNGLDRYCHIHDLCYNQFHVDAGANFPHSGITLNSAQVAGIRGCNQALANGAKGLMGRVNASLRSHESVVCTGTP